MVYKFMIDSKKTFDMFVSNILIHDKTFNKLFEYIIMLKKKFEKLHFTFADTKQNNQPYNFKTKKGTLLFYHA